METEAGERVPSTFALIVNTAIMAKCAHPEDVCDWVLQQTADVIIIIWDPDVLRAKEGDADEETADAALRLYAVFGNARDAKGYLGQPRWHQLGLRCLCGVEVGIVLARCRSIAEAIISC